MGEVTLKDITLAEYDLERLPLLGKLRRELMAMKPEVCIERARFVTRYLAGMSNPDDAVQIRYARAVNHFLVNKAPVFFGDNLLAGSTTSKPYGAPVYPEFTGMTRWPELDTISTREKNKLLLSKSDAEELNLRIYPCWMDRNLLEYTRSKFNYPEYTGPPSTARKNPLP